MTLKSILELSAKETLSDYVTAIAWSPTGNTLAAASGSGEVRLLKNFVSLSLCQSTGQSVDALAFSFDGKWLAAGGQDGTITLWQMDGDVPEIADTLECGSWVDRLVWHPTCHHLAFNQGKTVQIWDADRAEAVTTLAGIASPQDIRWSPDGKHLAIAIKSNVHIWNAHHWDERLYQWELTSPASAIAWSPDGALLACAIHDHSIGVLNWSTAQHLQCEPTNENDLPTLMRGFPGKIRQLAWVDARHLTAAQRHEILAAMHEPSVFPSQWHPIPAGWRIEPRPTLLEHPRWGWLLAIALLLIPAVLAVWFANTFAAIVDPLIQGLVNPTVEVLSGLPSLPREILIGRYGLVTMGPLLFVWAVPTVILYALFLGAYKASGLVERITVALHPLLRPFGLSGRDLVRVIMGFGCNVPAVISTRACSSCSRKTCISAIAFGSACSYQLGATLGVFSAANLPYLVIPYLLYLAVTTLIYTRLIAPKAARSPQNSLMIEHRTFLDIPRWSAIWREMKGTLSQFFTNAIPIFLVITLIASVLDWLGVLNGLSWLINPAMGLFRLPPEAALPVILASVRKDGLLLFAEPNMISLLSPVQILTGVYLAGVLLPCLVTALTIAREQSPKFALGLMVRQAIAAIVFALILAWGGYLIQAT